MGSNYSVSNYGFGNSEMAELKDRLKAVAFAHGYRYPILPVNFELHYIAGELLYERFMNSVDMPDNKEHT